MRSTRVLFVTRVLPLENSSGARSYVLDLLKFLKSRNFDIELALIDASLGGRSPVVLIPSELMNICQVACRNHFRIGRFLIKIHSLADLFLLLFGLTYYLIPERKRYACAKSCSFLVARLPIFRRWNQASQANRHLVKNYLATSRECRFVTGRAETFNPDVIVVHYAWLAKVFDEFADDKTIEKVIVAHDVIHEKNRRAENLGIKWGHVFWTKEMETQLLRKANMILAIQEEDRLAMEKMAPDAEVLCIPMSAVPRFKSRTQIPGRCLFVGSNGIANVQGLKWFLDNAWARILSYTPGCELHVCGTVCNEISRGYPQVKFLGRVDNLGEEYGAAEVCVVPLKFGSGLKIKLVEALAHGRACVSTDIGLEGLRDVDGRAIIRANTAEEFADAVHAVVSDVEFRLKMEREAKRYVYENLTPERVYQPFVDRILCRKRSESETNVACRIKLGKRGRAADREASRNNG